MAQPQHNKPIHERGDNLLVRLAGMRNGMTPVHHVQTVDGRNPAPPKKPWNDDSNVNTNEQWLPCERISSIHSLVSFKEIKDPAASGENRGSRRCTSASKKAPRRSGRRSLTREGANPGCHPRRIGHGCGQWDPILVGR